MSPRNYKGRVTSDRFSLFYLCLVMALAFGLRVSQLNNLPLSLSLDEATNGLDALRLLHQTWPVPFLANNFGRETLFFYFQGLALQGYGLSIFSFRFVSAIAAMLTLPLTYIVGRRLRLDVLPFSAPTQWYSISLLATTGLAVSYWHIYFSRVGLRAILLLPILLALVWSFWRGWFGPQRRWLIFAGALLGLTFYTYLAARLLPAIFLIFTIIELLKSTPQRTQKLINFLTFSLAALLTAIPLLLYYIQNPQILNSRTDALSILKADTPIPLLLNNLSSLAQIFFGAGMWQGQWPSLNVLIGLGLAVGLLVCLYHLKKPACLFLLLWWLAGIVPILISRQDWTATTTLLRGIVAWPAIFLIAAIGLVSLTRLAHRFIKQLNTLSQPAIELALLGFVLLFGTITSANNYFSTWATTYNDFSDHPPYLTRYLNRQTDQLSLVPLKFYGETVGHFLLQARYPHLINIDPQDLRHVLSSAQSAVYLIPTDSGAEAGFVLLDPATNTAYLLPSLSAAQVTALTQHSQNLTPLDTILDSEQESIAQVYPLSPDAPFLPTDLDPQLESIQATFADTILLTDYHVTPATLNPGETVTLQFNWQALRPLQEDYILFVHLFHIATGQRYGQVNVPLTGILFDAYRWPTRLIVPDQHTFTLPPDAPTGPYRFDVGLYQAKSLERLPVSAVTHEASDDKLTLGKFHVGQSPPSQHPLKNSLFDNSIVLLSLDALSNSPLQPDQTLTYTLRWQALAPLNQNYVVFNHLLNSNGDIIAQKDTQPVTGRYPTTWWDPNEIIVDPYTLTLPPNLAPGSYTLRIGLYEAETGQRLPLKNQPQDFVDFPNLITVE